MKLTNSKETAIRAFLNEWLKDPQHYCNNCHSAFVEGENCCDNPHIVTNLVAMHLLVQQNKIIRESRLNKYGSNKSKNIRMLVGMTQKMWDDISDYCIMTLKEPFLKDDKETQDFVRSFPQFRLCEVV